MNEITTKGDLARLGMDALDRERVGQVAVIAGGVSFASALEVMEFAKLISTGGEAIPKPFRNNPGMCLATCFQAIEWRMSPIAVMQKAYVVNDRLGYESQLLHAVVERRAPLKHRLDCTYDGTGQDRTCTVTGVFTDGEVREYTTPKIKDIKVKNSPLWTGDPDQQLFYSASRSWARKWCPDVLLGIYTRDELADNPGFGREEEPIDLGLRARLAGKTGEGHQDGHAAAELATLDNGEEYQTIEEVAVHEAVEAGQGQGGAAPAAETAPKGRKGRPELKRRTSEAPAAKSAPAEKVGKAAKQSASSPAEAAPEQSQGTNDATEAKPAPVMDPPTTAAEYTAYAEAWIKTEEECAARWEAEADLRNQLRVPIKERHRLMGLIQSRDEGPLN